MAALRLAAREVEHVPEQAAERGAEDVQDPQPGQRGVRHSEISGIQKSLGSL